MTYLVLGILILLTAIYFLREAHHHHDHEMEYGMKFVLIAGIFLIVLYGVYSQWMVLH